jgi:nicotinamide-nucleotide amidase
MIVEVVASGTELIRGRSIDTNSPYIARRLNAAGHDVRYISCYGDNIRELCRGIAHAFTRAQIVIMTGGLGPTVDDLTRQAVAKVTRRKLVLVRAELERQRNRPKINERQAYFPKGAAIIPNPVGTASGFLVKHGRRVLAALPGVPREMEPMLETTIPMLNSARVTWIDKAFKMAGMSESAVETELYPEIRKFKNVDYGITAKSGVISVILRVHGRDAAGTIDRIRTLIREKLGNAFFGEDEDTIGGRTAQLLLARRKTIAIAESCTGGEIASRLTDVPGVSESLIEALVTYSNDSKVKRLGVKESTLSAHGAVSEEVAREMAEGVRGRCDIGVSTTGIAGPTGGSAEKPVGLVYMAVATERGIAVERKVFGGSRWEIKSRAAEFTLNMIRKALLDEK